MFNPRKIARNIYDEDYKQAISQLLETVEQQQNKIETLEKEMKNLKETMVVKL